MRWFSTVTLSCSILLWGPVVEAQTTYGLLVGRSLVGGDSRTIVDIDGIPVTGAGRAGSHVRGMIDFKMPGSSFSLRAEVFYNQLSSNANTS